MDLQTPISEAGKLLKMRTAILKKLGIQTIEDLIYYVPFRYDDFSLISKISKVRPLEVATIRGIVVDIKSEFTKNWKKLQKATIQDESGTMDVVWFNQPFLTKVIRKGDLISLSGTVNWFSSKLVLQSPEYEILQDENAKTIHTGRIVPVYPETSGITSKWIRRQIFNIIYEYKQNILEHLPYSVINNNNLIDLFSAIEQIHFPKTIDSAKIARQRLAFDELFLLQLAALKRRESWRKNKKGNVFSIKEFKKEIDSFLNTLPFILTNSQKNALEDILKDFTNENPMNRLLEGDVGSGKTVVSAISMYAAYLNGYQSVLMAPTEILATQHYKTISDLLAPFGVKVGLATGSKKLGIENSEFKILIGTHAVLSENIEFSRLGLIVIDEQQRFGVEQRSIMRSKGRNPHLLTMTATPIPRTVALTLYGDLDVSYLNELPIGRKKIKTWLVSPEKRENAYKWIEEQIVKNQDQAFIICPFIEESESMQTIKAAKKEYEKLQKEVFKNLKLGLLHGKMKSKEKDKVLEDFKNKKIDILVATPVVEVGIDIKNATIMLIEASERFGLSQLHQLRGRVGRGEKQSYCLLFTESKNPQTLQRLKAMETMHVGAELAELDLKLRGPGEMFGTMQHGAKELKIASFSDFSLITKARKEAENIFKDLEKHKVLSEKIEKITLKNISPD